MFSTGKNVDLSLLSRGSCYRSIVIKVWGGGQGTGINSETSLLNL